MVFSKQGEVSITAESPILESPGDQATSMYQIKGDMGPILSFDTYNHILHQFSDPNPDGLGYEGDYEFIILNVAKDKIELKGKKNGTKMQMIPLPNDMTWESYSSKLDKMIEAFPGFTMRLNVNDRTLPDFQPAGRSQLISRRDGLYLYYRWHQIQRAYNHCRKNNTEFHCFGR